jgi:glycosyltransferase involved in cell wall biosynthesis
VTVPRVLHVLDHLTVSSGVARVALTCVQSVTSQRQDIAVYGAIDPELVKIVEAQGGRVFKLPPVTRSLGQPFRKAFVALLREHPYHAVHGHLLNSAFIYLREAKRQGIAHRIIHAHNTVSADRPLKRLRNDVLAMGVPRWANRYIACSALAAQRMFRAKAREALIIHNGIDVAQFRYDADTRRQVRQELGIPDDVLCVGQVGRFAPQKNHRFTLEVFRALRQRRNAVLVLAGDGPLEAAIKAQAAAQSGSIRFLGARADINRLYQAFDVFIFPSRFEGFGIAAV